MKNNLHISASFDRPELLVYMVEKLTRRSDVTHKLIRTGTWEELDTSSVESYVTGTMDIEWEEGKIKMPFISIFLFSCTKEKSNPYKMNWSMSLS